MADISKCAVSEQCERRERCYRYVSADSHYQSYIAPPEPGLSCEYYWPLEDETQISNRNPCW